MQCYPIALIILQPQRTMYPTFSAPLSRPHTSEPAVRRVSVALDRESSRVLTLMH